MTFHWYDFEQDETLRAKLNQFLENLKITIPTSVDPVTYIMSSYYLKNYSKLIQKIENGSSSIKQGNLVNTCRLIYKDPPPQSLPPLGDFDIYTVTILELDPVEVARQMTIYLFSTFHSILPQEFLEQSGPHMYALLF